MRILFTTICLEKADSHIVALTLASGLAKKYPTFFFKGVIQNYALAFSSVISTGLFASLRASDTGLIS